MFIRALALLPCLLALVMAGPAGAAEDADTAVLKKLLAEAATKGTTLAQLSALADKVGDAALRDKTKAILPEIEKAAALHVRVQQLIADVKEVQGKTTTEPGGPAWLREKVGDESMMLFDRLTGIDLQDRTIPIKSGKKNERITDDWLSRVADLPDLKALDISITVVRGPGLKHVGTLKTLESLNLTLCLVTDDQLGQLRDLTHLRAVSFASTQCTGEGFKDLEGWTALRNLNFHYTPVNDEGLRQISKLTDLERLEIVHTQFTDAGAEHLSKITGLQRLQMGSQKATGAAVAPLRSLKQLRELDLHDAQASTEGAKNAGEIPSLTVLRIYGPIKDEGAGHLAKLANLETLILESSQMTDTGLGQLAALKKLKRLEIKNIKVTEEAVAKLKQALPGVEIVR